MRFLKRRLLAPAAAGAAAAALLTVSSAGAARTQTIRCLGTADYCGATVRIVGAAKRVITVRLTDTNLKFVGARAVPGKARGDFRISNASYRLGGSEYRFTLHALRSKPRGARLVLLFAAGSRANIGVGSPNAYSFVHAHLRVGITFVKQGYAVVPYPDCFSLPAGIFPHYVDWAEKGVRDGYCLGHYEAGSSNPSLNGKGGFSEWHYDDRGLHITQGVNLGTRHAELVRSRPWIECDLSDRNSGDCYTNESQKGKTGQGGPLQLDAHVPGGYVTNYILLRGWCETSDTKCNSVGPIGARR